MNQCVVCAKEAQFQVSGLSVCCEACTQQVWNSVTPDIQVRMAMSQDVSALVDRMKFALQVRTVKPAQSASPQAGVSQPSSTQGSASPVNISGHKGATSVDLGFSSLNSKNSLRIFHNATHGVKFLHPYYANQLVIDIYSPEFAPAMRNRQVEASLDAKAFFEFIDVNWEKFDDRIRFPSVMHLYHAMNAKDTYSINVFTQDTTEITEAQAAELWNAHRSPLITRTKRQWVMLRDDDDTSEGAEYRNQPETSAYVWTTINTESADENALKQQKLYNDRKWPGIKAQEIAKQKLFEVKLVKSVSQEVRLRRWEWIYRLLFAQFRGLSKVLAETYDEDMTRAQATRPRVALPRLFVYDDESKKVSKMGGRLVGTGFKGKNEAGYALEKLRLELIPALPTEEEPDESEEPEDVSGSDSSDSSE